MDTTVGSRWMPTTLVIGRSLYIAAQQDKEQAVTYLQAQLQAGTLY